MVEALSRRSLNRALLARQHLLSRKRKSVRDMIHAVGGLQTQEPKDPFVALFSRIARFDRDSLLDAAEARTIVRGTYLRATIHTVSVEDYADFRVLLQSVIDRELVIGRALGGGFTMSDVEPAARALMAKEPLTAQQLAKRLAPSFPDAQIAGLARWIRTCIPLIMVPSSSERFGYARPPRFVPADAFIDRPLGTGTLEGLVLRGLSAIGPASSADLRVWSRLAGIRPVIEALRPKLRVFRDDRGRELFDLEDAPRPPEESEAPVRFLPEYDNVFLSHDDRSRVMPEEHAHHFTAQKNGRRLRTVLVDGFVRGGWAHECAKDSAKIEVQLFEKTTKKLAAEIATEAEALLRFLEPAATRFLVNVK